MQNSTVQRHRTLTLRVNNLQMIAAQVKALQVVDCNVLLRTSCYGLDTVVAQIECHQFVVSHEVLDTANKSPDVNTEQAVYPPVYLKCWILLLVIDNDSRDPRFGNILNNRYSDIHQSSDVSNRSIVTLLTLLLGRS